MAAFTDQFERRDPLLFNAYAMLSMWPRQTAWEARTLVKGRSVEDLTGLARLIDASIISEAMRVIAPGASVDDSPKSNPKTAFVAGSASDLEAIETVRREHGDVNLFEAAGGHRTIESDAHDFTAPEAFATLALWKLVDCYDSASSNVSSSIGDILVIDREPYRPDQLGTKEARGAKRSIHAWNSAAVEALESMRACTIGSQLKLHAGTTRAMEQAFGAAMQNKLADEANKRAEEASARARQAGAARWATKASHEAEALRIAMSRDFRTRADAARAAEKELVKVSGFFTVATIDGWLKRANWKPRPRTK